MLDVRNPGDFVYVDIKEATDSEYDLESIPELQGALLIPNQSPILRFTPFADPICRTLLAPNLNALVWFCFDPERPTSTYQDSTLMLTFDPANYQERQDVLEYALDDIGHKGVEIIAIASIGRLTWELTRRGVSITLSAQGLADGLGDMEDSKPIMYTQVDTSGNEVTIVFENSHLNSYGILVPRISIMKSRR